MTASAPRHWRDHVVVCGSGSLAHGLVLELAAAGERAVCVAASISADIAARLSDAGIAVVVGNCRDAAVLRDAGVEGAKALSAAERDDVVNLHCALTAEELHPGIRIVMRTFNENLGLRAQHLLGNGTVLSASTIAAPLFAAAALSDRQPSIPAGDVQLALRRSDALHVRDGALLARVDDDSNELLPPPGDGEYLVLDLQPREDARPRGRQRRAQLATLSAALLGLFDRRMRTVLSIMAVLLIAGTIVYSLGYGLRLIDAVYFTVTTITTTGFGDITVGRAPDWIKVFTVLLLICGAIALAVFYALIIDALVGARLARGLGGVRGRRSDHIVVCGLGNVGIKVLRNFHQQGISCIAVERRADAEHLAEARTMGVPVVRGDAALESTLREAQSERARSLLVLTDSDVANLEAALAARDLRADLPVVLRLADPDLARRAESRLGLSLSRSVTALAAPAFAAALLEHRVLGAIPIGQRVLQVAEMEVKEGSRLAGRRIAEIEVPGEGRILGTTAQGGALRWGWAPEDRVDEGMLLLVVATQAGLAQLLSANRS